MRDAQWVKTVLDIDADVLKAAKEIAANRAVSVGRVLSELARATLVARVARRRNGVPLMPRRAKVIRRPTLHVVNTLRDVP